MLSKLLFTYRRAIGFLVLLLIVLIAVVGFRWSYGPREAPASSLLVPTEIKSVLRKYRDEPIQPIAENAELDARIVALGRKLFHDPRLSHDNSISCATCHVLNRGGVDGLARSLGIDGAIGDVNAPTVLNSGLNFRQFWDGRSDSLESQVDGPTHNSKEMGSNWEEIVAKLSRDEELRLAFAQLYPDGLHPRNIRNAIATFERSLSTANSRFDRFLNGDDTAITAAERRGYELFKEYGCISCHQGKGVGGNMFQRFGVMGDYFQDRGHPTSADLGRFNVTGEERDRHRFKVPGLRNVELTSPYFHDGSILTLEDAVRVMSRYQLGVEIPEEEVRLIVDFLRTLTGQFEGNSS